MRRFDEFLAAYRRLEEGLRRVTGNFDNAASFSRLLRESACKSRIVSHEHRFITKIKDLRNLLVHDGHNGFTLAEPTEPVIAKLNRIDEALVHPPRLPKDLFHEVQLFKVRSPLGETLAFMRKNDFSQVPIKKVGEFESLLTTNTIARWLADNVDDEIVEIKATPLGEIISARETNNDYLFCSSKANCEAVIDLFERSQEKGELLQAVLLSDSGKADTNIRGIVTPHDLGKLYGALMVAP